MKKNTIIVMAITASFLLTIFVSSTFSVYKKTVPAYSQVSLASWDVHLNQTGVNNSLTVVYGVQEASYTLNVYNESQVDVRYSVIISNIPSGVEVSIDDPTNFDQPDSTTHIKSYADIGTILYSDLDHTNSHIIRFRSTAGATPVNAQTINIDVVVRQIV